MLLLKAAELFTVKLDLEQARKTNEKNEEEIQRQLNTIHQNIRDI